MRNIATVEQSWLKTRPKSNVISKLAGHTLAGHRPCKNYCCFKQLVTWFIQNEIWLFFFTCPRDFWIGSSRHKIVGHYKNWCLIPLLTLGFTTFSFITKTFCSFCIPLHLMNKLQWNFKIKLFLLLRHLICLVLHF